VHDTAEAVGHVPVRGLVAHRIGRAALHILRGHRVAVAVATHVRADGGTGHHAPDRGQVLACAATDLVAQDATDDAADQGTGHVGGRPLRCHRLALDPAALLGLAHDGAHGQYVGLVQLLVGAAAVVPWLRVGGHRDHGGRRLLHRLLVHRIGGGATGEAKHGHGRQPDSGCTAEQGRGV